MTSFRIERYSETHNSSWNGFIPKSRSKLFLFDRRYMDYHADRFTDHSVIVFRNDEIVALFPANETQTKEIHSHGGLTFGGIVLASETKLADAVNILQQIREYYEKQGFKKLIYKQLPSIFNEPLSNEDDYCLFRVNASLIRCDSNFVIEHARRPSLQERRLRGVKKARAAGLEVRESQDIETFWDGILAPTLLSQHGVKPVHSVDEIKLLKSRFPDCIRLYAAFLADRMVGGTVIYEYQNVAHSQYIAASDEGRATGALDLVFSHAIELASQRQPFFSFGIANENDGQILNAGLAEWKESFGARCITHRFFSISLS